MPTRLPGAPDQTLQGPVHAPDQRSETPGPRVPDQRRRGISGARRLPAGTSWPLLAGIATVAGIGFTVALFITELAFEGAPLAAEAKIGVIAASLAAKAAVAEHFSDFQFREAVLDACADLAV